MSTDAAISVGLISLGCAKNLVDTQIMSGVLLSEGLTLARSVESATVVLINTCSFIQPAREEAFETIEEMIAHKAAGGCRAIIVTGCLPQRYRAALATRYPDVDAWLGVDELEEIATIATRVATHGTAAPLVSISPEPQRLFTPRLPTLTFSEPGSAWLKIAEGCNHACAFCAIPAIRGRHRSRPLAGLVEEAAALLQDGRHEINLISQDTTWYGRDRLQGPRLPQLLQTLDELPGTFWLRLLYGYPAAVDDALLEVMANANHLLPYLDLPLQHSHPDILRAMRRADSIESVATLASRLRTALPGVTLRTTCLVGFPGESEAHFQHLLDYIRAARFDHLGAFAFSPEEGTHAATLPDQVPAEVAAARRDTLMELQQTIAHERGRARIGCETTALLLAPPQQRRGAWLARASWQAPDVDGLTHVQHVPAGAQPGDLVSIRIKSYADYDYTALCC